MSINIDKTWIQKLDDEFNLDLYTDDNRTRPALETISTLQKLTDVGITRVVFHGGGDSYLDSFSHARERGCLELRMLGLCYVLRPKSITFEYICAEPALSFFFMDLHLLKPCGVYDDICGDTEELAEIDGQYFDRDLRYKTIDQHDDAGRLISIPGHARPVNRLLRGHLLFVDPKSAFWQRLGYGYFWNATSSNELRDLITAQALRA